MYGKPRLFIAAGRIALWVLLLLSLAAPAAAQGRIVLDKDVPYQILGPHMELLEDRERSLTIQQVSSAPYRNRFVRFDKQVPSFGFTESAFWYRTELVNPSDQPQEVILEEVIPYIDSIQVYLPDSQAPDGFDVRVTGDKQRFAEREINHHYFLFRLIVPPQQSLPLYIRVQSRAAMITPFTFWQHDAFINHAHGLALSFGAFFAILAVFFGLSCFLMMRQRERIYLFYALFILSVALMVFTSHGLSYMYLWPESPWLSEHMQVICISLIQFCGLLFARAFLDTRKNMPRCDKLLQALTNLHGFIIVALFVVEDFVPLAKLTIVSVQFYAPVLLLSGVQALRQGNRSARFYLLAWSSSLIGSSLTSLTLLNVLPYHFLLLNAVTIGFLFDSVLLSFALADRIFMLREEHKKAQQLVHDTLHNANEKLEYEVERRTCELQVAKQEAEFANRAKTRFLSNISHELRTPLIGIIGFAEYLTSNDKEPLTPGQAKSAKIILNSGIHLQELIDDVLNISMIESGKMEIDNVPVRFDEVLDEALDMVSDMADKREAELVARDFSAGPCWVSADRLRLRQVIINLLSNAIKYSDPPGRVSVALQIMTGGIRLAVEDNGPGIFEEHLETIFEPFSRIETHPNSVDGVGIGLALSKKLVGLMNGELMVESTVGEGSVFYVELPVANVS